MLDLDDELVQKLADFEPTPLDVAGSRGLGVVVRQVVGPLVVRLEHSRHGLVDAEVVEGVAEVLDVTVFLELAGF